MSQYHKRDKKELPGEYLEQIESSSFEIESDRNFGNR